MKSIPVHQLQDRTNVGLQLDVFKPGQEYSNKNTETGAHRDDHYIFFLLKKGGGSLRVDLQDITLAAGQLFYILPSQIHHRIKTDLAEGWFLAVDPSLIHPNWREVFEGYGLTLQAPCTLTPSQLMQYSNLLGLLEAKYNEKDNNEYYIDIIHTLLQSFLAMAASSFNNAQVTGKKHTRYAEISRQFRQLLAAHSRTIRSPSVYASMLNVSEAYLNESLKKTTGSPVSYWIQQEILIEAKRLLYHSDMDVKQIAHELGYEDHSYFSRYFRKASGMSALAFRSMYRK